MKNNRCEQCGANINIKSMTCDYCGAVYSTVTADTKTTEDKVFNNKNILSLSDKDIINILNKLSPSFFVILPTIVFLSIWCTVTLGTGIFTASQFGPFAIMPVFMFIIGVVIMLSSVRNITKNRITVVINACNSGKWNEALQLCERNEYVNHNYVLAYILIKVHHFKAYDGVGVKLARIPRDVLSKTLLQTPVFGEIAEFYGQKIEFPLPINMKFFN